jgi:hypothetical protein
VVVIGASFTGFLLGGAGVAGVGAVLAGVAAGLASLMRTPGSD